jgi:hypothetical protein
MNKTFISKTTQLAERVEAARKRHSDLDEEFNDLKRDCDHRNPEGKLSLKSRVGRTGKKRYTYKVCGICGEDVYKDCYGRLISVWNHLDIPEERKRALEKIMGNL